MKKILVCDDDFIIIKLMENRLVSEGYEVVTVSDGNKALEVLKNEDFDLVLTDMHMPFITGMEIIDFIRNDLKKKVPIIIITKDTSESTAENAYELGADDYINKPVNMNVLSLKVKKLMQ